MSPAGVGLPVTEKSESHPVPMCLKDWCCFYNKPDYNCGFVFAFALFFVFGLPYVWKIDVVFTIEPD